jgi:hypothetical protein
MKHEIVSESGFTMANGHHGHAVTCSCGEIAIVEVRGGRIEGTITVEDGVTKFRQLANHHGGHLMWYPPRAD